ncbi:MAG: helix-hairpin-helix domain-containing protein [Runella sp.]
MLSKLLLLIRDEFGLSRAQARGLLVLAVGMLVCWFGPLAFDRFFANNDAIINKTDEQKADSLLAILEKLQPQKTYTSSYSPISRADVSPETPLSLFYFDPNTASVSQLQALGMPKFIAERIEKYRSKGGKFRQKEDLQKIYGLRPELYERLEPYISIVAETPKTALVATNTPTSPAKEAEILPKAPKITTFDINTADTTQLIRLRGIGSKLAARIVKFRDGLGGFVSESQYAEIFGLDSLALAELYRFAQVRTPPQQISINTASIENLDRHPYISRRQAEIIIRYREQHGAYQSPQDLLRIKILDEKFVNKIAPYLAF